MGGVVWIWIYPYLTKIQRDAYVSRSPLQGAFSADFKTADLSLIKSLVYTSLSKLRAKERGKTEPKIDSVEIEYLVVPIYKTGKCLNY